MITKRDARRLKIAITNYTAASVDLSWIGSCNDPTDRVAVEETYKRAKSDLKIVIDSLTEKTP